MGGGKRSCNSKDTFIVDPRLRTLSLLQATECLLIPFISPETLQCIKTVSSPMPIFFPSFLGIEPETGGMMQRQTAKPSGLSVWSMKTVANRDLTKDGISAVFLKVLGVEISVGCAQ